MANRSVGNGLEKLIISGWQRTRADMGSVDLGSTKRRRGTYRQNQQRRWSYRRALL